ncbi:MAG: MoaD/ThiS family protein [Elusimicrobia bacterium]|nr:MoaD/ThiS family protein [Elusimicrobiota bacterium]
MRVIVKFFGIFSELADAREKSVSLESEITALELYQRVTKEFPQNRRIPKILFAVNEEFVKPGYRLKDGDVCAFIPPMCGG